MPTFFNSIGFNVLATDSSALEVRRSGVTAVDPQDTAYDYRLELCCNLTQVLEDLTMFQSDELSSCEAESGIL